MSSAYTPYQLKGKVINIPNTELNKLQSLLRISRSEAINVWLSDNDYIEVAEIEELTAKAKENKVSHNARAEYKPKTQRERVVKADPTKEGIITAIAEMLPTLNAENVVIANKGKLITFTIGEDNYKLDLIRQRPPKAKG
jgi:hypothetical protein